MPQGSGPGGHLWAAGAATESLIEWRGLKVGGEVEVWNQPSHGTGAGGFARLMGTRGWLRGFQADVGAKGGGHWPGRPADAGPFLRVGYQFPVR